MCACIKGVDVPTVACRERDERIRDFAVNWHDVGLRTGGAPLRTSTAL
jgi:hypothetical protein